MGFSYMKSKLVQVNPYSTPCLNNIVSDLSHNLVEKATCSPLNASSYMYGFKPINPTLLLGCGTRFYNANPNPLPVYAPSRALQVCIWKKKQWWQWLRNRKYKFIEIFILFNVLFARLETVPYSNRINIVTANDKLERFKAQYYWKKTEKEYQESILPSTHPQSVRVQSILRDIVQGMHSGLGLKQDCNVSRHGSEDTLVVSRRVHQEESQTRPKKSIIKLGTGHLEGMNWEVMVVESDKTNAEYFSNGKIVIYTGMLDRLVTDDEIATVLGHEVGHGVARHNSEHLMRVLWSCALIWVLRRLLILPLLVKPSDMYFSRRDESEADYIGLMLMASAGYHPQVAPIFYKVFCHSEEDWLSTHPSGRRRARLLKENNVMGEALTIYKQARSRIYV